MAKLNASCPTISADPSFAVTISRSHWERAAVTLAASVQDAPDARPRNATRRKPGCALTCSAAVVAETGVEFIRMEGEDTPIASPLEVAYQYETARIN